MLTKLVWHIISNPDSLIAGILGAKYAKKANWLATMDLHKTLEVK